MYGQFDLITLIALIVAVAAILKLRSVLGHRSDEDEQRVERLKKREAGQRAAAETASADVITMPRRDRDPLQPAPAIEAPVSNAEARIKAFSAVDPSVTKGLLEIAKLDTSLDPESFLSGAGRAYEMIVSAFAEGNRRALKDLLSREVYDGFVAAIAEREVREEKIEQQFVGIKKADLVEAELKNGVASLTVRFVSELISATKDKAGEIVSGDTQTIKNVTDIWTFSRDVSTAKARTIRTGNWSRHRRRTRTQLQPPAIWLRVCHKSAAGQAPGRLMTNEVTSQHLNRARACRPAAGPILFAAAALLFPTTTRGASTIAMSPASSNTQAHAIRLDPIPFGDVPGWMTMTTWRPGRPSSRPADRCSMRPSASLSRVSAIRASKRCWMPAASRSRRRSPAALRHAKAPGNSSRPSFGRIAFQARNPKGF